MDPWRDSFAEKRVLITGGLGFIGSNLARRLVPLGARVTLIDCLLPQFGGSRRNIAGLERQVRVEVGDIRDHDRLGRWVRGQDFIFNLAGQTSHWDSMTDPAADLD